VLRRAWVQVVSGRQEGRMYLLSRPRSTLGLDERADVGLFADALVARRHAEIESTSRGYILHHVGPPGRTRVNGDVVTGELALKDGDRIELGHTLLVFRQR
ncbi:MAG: FHA domain-containing protein, partial [Planctomycetia bacterium]|nr:FHA domain-containing protein [Planctomycetia bacterium]